jgi:hypothetical protein
VGAVLGGFVGCYSVLLATGYVVAGFIARYQQTGFLAARVGGTVAYAVVGGFLAFAMFPVLEDKWTGIVQWLPVLFKDRFEVNPVQLQLVLGASYALLAPSKSVFSAYISPPNVHWPVSIGTCLAASLAIHFGTVAENILCRYVVLALPFIVHTSFFNPHMSIERADASLRMHNWTLLDRQWSNTGYISVLESQENQYRSLRADHSLLGA